MTIYLDQYFAEGTSQQIGSVEKITLDENSNCDIVNTGLTGLNREFIITSSPAKNARIRVDGFKQRDGRTPSSDKLWIPASAQWNSDRPSVSLAQLISMTTAMAWMMGGSVSIGADELQAAAGRRKLTVYQVQDPYRLQLNVTED